MRGDWDETLELNREQTGGYCGNRQEKDRMMCLHISSFIARSSKLHL